MSQRDAAGAVDRYVRGLFAPEDEVLAGFRSDAEAAGLPVIQVPPELGKLLALLVKATGARRVLEIGTLGGYSAAWMARALPEDGRLTTLELEPKHAAFARSLLDRAGVGEKVEVVVGSALETLPGLLDGGERFDLAFIDADKQSYPAYLDWCLRLVRPGGLIIGDNVIRGGGVIEPGADPVLTGVAEFNRRAASSPLLDALILPNRDGEDGVLIAVVRDTT